MLATLHEHSLFAGSAVLGGIHRLSADVEPHVHDFVEIAVVGPGRGRHVTSQGERPVRYGDVIVLRPGAWHGFRRCRDLVVGNCCISAQALRHELAALLDVPMFHRLLWTEPVAAGAHGLVVTSVGRAEAGDALAVIEALERDLASGRPVEGRVFGHVATVLGILADGRRADDRADEARAPAVHAAVAATVSRLEAAPEQAWRLEDLAAAASVDPAYLGRLFRKHMGVTPLGYLARIRAERAAVLLAHTDLPAGRVGASVGWDDPTYFARRFRALAGLSPSEYRRRGAGTQGDSAISPPGAAV
ncbi:AraC family transcriptional regulator [Jiangella anatolica]|uniref:AraC family transcriptional regulator n=1 Tax=Jiangella anatolica TaxID=2670374 RepID=A0A2W2CBN9_9ACTN|nr:AraC family transcriptional regulator [Jiangella anatolica]PZF85609.1 AraC family transcriptional regulator [Jiangella anatolica]